MIFVMFGTNPYPFERLMNGMSNYAHITGEKIVAQCGNTPPVLNIECHRYIRHSDIVNYISSADVVVCQGGYGSLYDCLSLGAKTVAVPRRKELGECPDNQAELVDALSGEGLIIPVHEIDDLPDAIFRARNMQKIVRKVSCLPAHIAKTIETMLSEAGK